MCRLSFTKDVFLRQAVFGVSQGTKVPFVFALNSVKCSSINDS